jgi:hypothetical protein
LFSSIGIRFCQFLDLLFYWYKWFTGQFLQAVLVFLELITALLSSTAFLVPSSVVLRFLLGDMYRYRRICCTEIELPNIGLSTFLLLLLACRWATIDIIIYALGNSSIMVAFIHQNSKSI